MRARHRRADRGLTVVRALLLVGAVGLVAVLAYRQISRLTERPMPVWVSARALRAGETPSNGDIRLVQTRTPPAGALVLRTDIEGRRLLQDKPVGEPFFGRDLAPRQPKKGLAATVPDGRLLATVKIGSMDIPVPELYEGNRLDLLQAHDDGVHLIARDAQVMGTLRTSAKANGDSGKIFGIDVSVPGIGTGASNSDVALVLAIQPSDVFTLTAAEATGKKLKVVLHSEGEIKSGKFVDLRVPPAPARRRAAPPLAVELVAGAKSEKIYFK